MVLRICSAYVFIIFFCLTSAFQCVVGASVFFDGGINSCERGNFYSAKKLFNKSLKTKTLTADQEKLAHACILAMSDPPGQTLASSFSQSKEKQTECSLLFFRILKARDSLYKGDSSLRKMGLSFLKKIFRQAPIACYFLAEYYEYIVMPKVAQALYYFAAHSLSFEAAKTKILKIRKKYPEIDSIKFYKSRLEIASMSIPISSSEVDTSRFLHYDLALAYEALTEKTKNKKKMEKSIALFKRLIRDKNPVVQVLCYQNKSLCGLMAEDHFTLSKDIVKNLLSQVESDALYISSFAFLSLRGVNLPSVPIKQSFKLKNNLKKLAQLYYIPAMMLHYSFLGKDLQDCGYGQSLLRYAVNFDNRKAQYLYAIGLMKLGDMCCTHKALKLLEKAAYNNCAESQYLLGEIYYSGVYLPQDIGKSIFWLERAATTDISYRATHALGNIYLNCARDKVDFQKSFYYYLLSANQYYPPSALSIGINLLNGNFGIKNFDLALFFFAQAALWGCGDSLYEIAWMVYRGRGCVRNVSLSTSIFLHAARSGHLRSQHHIAWRNILGVGVSKNYNRGQYWLNRASNGGYYKSSQKLAYIYKFGLYNLSQDENKACFYFRLAREQGMKHGKRI